MAYLADLPARTQANLKNLDCPVFDNKPRVEGPPLNQRRLALVSTAGLMLRGEKTVRRSEAGYREIPHSVPAGNILMSHVSINYDRTGFQQDINVVLPRDRLDEMLADGELGAVAQTHYAFMGATDPRLMQPHVKTLAAQLRDEQVDSALLLPV